jgi:hypothetical protein
MSSLPRPILEAAAEQSAPRENSEANTQIIVEEVANFIARFVFLPEPALYKLIALWVIGTHLHNQFEFFGYLFVHSPEPASGKSRLLEVLHLLVANSSGIQVSPSESVLFRTASTRTQLLDEVDSWANREYLRSVLNAGFQRGAMVSRMTEQVGGEYQPKEYPVFGPRALAGIGARILDITTRDRTFMIRMVRRKKSEQRERLRGRDIRAEANSLKTRIAEWCMAHGAAVSACYEESDFPYLEPFADRTMDITEPLAAIFEQAYAGHANMSLVRGELLDAVALTREEQSSLTAHHRILLELTRLSATTDPLIGSASELASMCRGLPERPSEYDVSGVVRGYGYKARSLRMSGGQPGYRYSLPHSELAELCSRYIRTDEDEAVGAATPATAATEAAPDIQVDSA